MKRPTLNLNSQLKDLQLHPFMKEADCLGRSAYRHFEANPAVPGVVLLQDGAFAGMISRRRFLEAMSRAYGRELFLQRPLSVLYQSIHQNILRLPGSMLITEAATRAINRSSDLLHEPIVVDCETHNDSPYCMLDVHDILQAQSSIHQLTTEMLKEKTRAELMQTEKMASLGRMMAGVAHEIRNPVNFIWGNLEYVSDYTKNLATLVQAYGEEVKNPSEELCEFQEQIDVEFILEDLSKVIQSIVVGTDRLRNLVTGLRTFSRVDEAKCHPTDLHQSLDGTLLILNNRIKEGITVVKEYGELPKVLCYSGQIGQVFMNIISNAIDALIEYRQLLLQEQSPNTISHPISMANQTWQPCITIRTQVHRPLDDEGKHTELTNEWVSISIQDNGPGIPTDLQFRIFEDFFTTKPAGEGTGLGLSITKQIVTEKHQGQLRLQSPCFSPNTEGLSKGTEFEILLPVSLPAAPATEIQTGQPPITHNGVDNCNPVMANHS